MVFPAISPDRWSPGAAVFWRRCGVALLAATGIVGLVGPAQSTPKAPKTLGFVVTTWNYAILESKFHDECPGGFAIGPSEIWWRSLSKAARAKATDNGKLNNSDVFLQAIARGPHKENVCLNPTLVKDPPMAIVEGNVAQGMNLDGTNDGHATAKTCAHQKFTSTDGEPAIDNQVYRLLGCVYGWHIYDNIQSNANVNRKTTGFGITLIEVSGVDDPRNAPDVTVTFSHAVGQYALDGQGEFLPYASYRADATNAAPGKIRYGGQVHGKIVDGVLTTDPVDMVLPFYGNYTYIGADGASAKGLAAGYYDVDQLLYYIGGLGVIAFPSQSDCPAQYDAARRLADGYPDPNTGECTALSSAYNFDAVAAFVIHPGDRADAASSGKPTHSLLAALGLGK
jgi:hypothetical protein